jgi:glycosyltransferase involved in cell wall biosynthesis
MVAHVGIPERKLQTIYNGCDVRGVNEKASSAIPAESDSPIIGMVARLNEIKDQSTLVKAMPSILEKYPSAELWIVGDGNQRESLETLSESMELEGNVQFLGNRSDVPSLLGKMDVFAFSTTEAEGFGIAIIEALAAEVPVVATDVGPCAEVLRGGEWGHLVPKKSPRRLGEKVIEVLESDRRAPNVEEVCQRYDKKISAERYWKSLTK